MRRAGPHFLLLVAAVACSIEPAPPARATKAPGSPAQPALLRLVATDYAFTGGSTVPAGLVELRVVNQGHALHMLNVTRLDSGKTVADLYKTVDKSPPPWASDLGGPNAVSPGDSASAYAVLEPGHYAITCWVPDSANKPHIMHGMITALEVTGASAGAPVEPTADIMMRERDYQIELSSVPGRGHHLIRVDNDGPQEHDVQILRLLPGKSVAQALDWFGHPAVGAPAAEAVGGLAGISRWSHGEFAADFAPGNYLILCWVPDATDGKPHFRHGMYRVLTVG